MRKGWSWVLVGLLVSGASACGEDPAEIQKECDAIATDIREEAGRRGLPSAGICSVYEPRTREVFGPKCEALKDCNDRVEEAK